jgi:predicted AAA+ superfamily ATPase
VQAEALTKNIEGFSRFLYLVAATTGQFLDLNKLSSEAAVPRQTASRFFEILEDTLIVARLPPFAKSERRRLVQHPRYFLFDTGVLGGLLESFTVSPDRVGPLFEQLLFNQLQTTAWSFDEPIRISSYRTGAGAEVDFIVETSGIVWAIEAKASGNVGLDDLSGLRSFAHFFGKPCRLIVAYLGDTRRNIEQVEVWPWQELLGEMFAAVRRHAGYGSERDNI